MEILKTHKDFKTIDPKFKDAETMDEYLGYALAYQQMFDRRTTPWEKTSWDDDKLKHFEIDLEKVDRLYYLYHSNDDCSGQDFQFAGRMDYDGQHLYVEFNASCDYTGFDCQGQGVIFVSSDANLFMKLVLTDDYQTDLIYSSLAEDGIEIEEKTEYDKVSRMWGKSPPMLKFLCHQTVYDHKKQLENLYTAVLPKILKESINDFIKTKEAIVYYDTYYD